MASCPTNFRRFWASSANSFTTPLKKNEINYGATSTRHLPDSRGRGSRLEIAGSVPARAPAVETRRRTRRERAVRGHAIPRRAFKPDLLHSRWRRSEEHTSELQSLRHLVC